MTKQEGKPRKERLTNTELPCPVARCRCTKDDHRPVKGTKKWFCYGKDCMDVCEPRNG